MAFKDEEATAHGHPPGEFAVEREDSASKAAGHMRLELVDDKPDPNNKGMMKNWRSGAGSWFDAWLTSAAAQIGQVMLALPNALANTGVRAGVPLLFVYSLFSMFTIHLLTALYAEYKARKVKAGKWEGGHNKKATQYFDVITELVGFWPGRFVLLITIISLCSTGIAQVIACSTGAYYLNTSISKRTWALIFGGALSGTMTFIPTFRHFRIYNIISLTGTAYSALYLVIAATAKIGLKAEAGHVGPTSMQSLFLGANVFMNAFGGHTLSFEVIDAMFQPSRYDHVYPFSYMYTYLVSVPHSILIQLANPTANKAYGNVYGVVPVSGARDVSIVLMIVHQFVAYALYVTPVFFMWEKLVRTHQKPLWIRLPSRLPVSLFVWFIALLLPFYNTINAIMGSFGNSFTAFVFPTGAYLWVYGCSAEARANAPKQPFLPGGWTTQLCLCAFLFVWFLVFGVGFGMWASILNLVQNVNTYSAFAECYQCAGIINTNALNG